jgi:hypothetical protein
MRLATKLTILENHMYHIEFHRTPVLLLAVYFSTFTVKDLVGGLGSHMMVGPRSSHEQTHSQWTEH